MQDSNITAALNEYLTNVWFDLVGREVLHHNKTNTDFLEVIRLLNEAVLQPMIIFLNHYHVPDTPSPPPSNPQPLEPPPPLNPKPLVPPPQSKVVVQPAPQPTSLAETDGPVSPAQKQLQSNYVVVDPPPLITPDFPEINEVSLQKNRICSLSHQMFRLFVSPIRPLYNKDSPVQPHPFSKLYFPLQSLQHTDYI
eukprot:TRINITY_DN4020_c0_g4_i1.p1 TRINITY_DN4020_c0_g4~~TRINITY_DN4020_c0_g4_i1.p1  ORF type:complete len:227 (-),score=30.00 TRINITY_DN4020_c0_g4_i1:51-635(-)